MLNNESKNVRLVNYLLNNSSNLTIQNTSCLYVEKNILVKYTSHNEIEVEMYFLQFTRQNLESLYTFLLERELNKERFDEKREVEILQQKLTYKKISTSENSDVINFKDSYRLLIFSFCQKLLSEILKEKNEYEIEVEIYENEIIF